MRFVWKDLHERQAECPVCEGGSAVDTLRVEHVDSEHDFVRCRSCQSAFPLIFEDEADLGGYSIGKAENDYGLKHYVEIGAGIDSLFGPVLALVDQPHGSLLDVGCGFGFLPSMWDGYSADTVAHGIELASYGHWGREILGAPISHKLLAENDEARVRQYDFVWSGEVIEHVPDPVQFLKDLSASLKPDGVLILTTPDADCVNPATPSADLAAALSLGGHRFLMSEQALRKLLNDAGFAYVVAKTHGTTLVIWASRSDLKLLPDYRERADRLVNEYLAQIAERENPWLRGGALYRLYREAVNASRWADAESIEGDLILVIEGAIGPQTTWKSVISQIVLNPNMGRDEYIASAPSYLGPFLHYRGMVNLNHRAEYTAAIADFDLAMRLNAYAAQNQMNIAQEPGRLIASCIFHRQLALSYANRDAQAFRAVALAHDPVGSAVFGPRYEREVTWTD